MGKGYINKQEKAEKYQKERDKIIADNEELHNTVKNLEREYKLKSNNLDFDFRNKKRELEEEFEEKTYNTDSLDIGLWKKILSLLGRSKKHLIALAVLMVFMAMLDVVRPYLDKIAIDYFAKGDFKTEEIIQKAEGATSRAEILWSATWTSWWRTASPAT